MKQEVQELATSLEVNQYGDASGTGLYLYQKQPRRTLLSQPLKGEDKKKNSTRREMLVFRNSYTAEEAWVREGRTVTRYTDNKSSLRSYKHGHCRSSGMPEEEHQAQG